MSWLFCFIFNVFIITANWLEAICVAARTQSPFPWKLWVSMSDMWHVNIHGSPISPFWGRLKRVMAPCVSLPGAPVACYCVRARSELPLPPWWTEAPTHLLFFWVVAVPFFYFTFASPLSASALCSSHLLFTQALASFVPLPCSGDPASPIAPVWSIVFMIRTVLPWWPFSALQTDWFWKPTSSN